jgi:hypothetical protein
MKEILINYLEESNQSKYKLGRRTQFNIRDFLTYNHLSLKTFKRIYKCMCEDGFVKYADEFRKLYKEQLKEKYKELLDFMEQK